MSSSVAPIRAHPSTCACCRTDVRRELRRPLHYAETHIDVELLTAAMDATKERLRVLIELEVRRISRRVSLTNPRPSLAVTPAMLAVLEQLRDLGRRAALAETASMGVHLSADVHARRYGAPRRVEGQIPDGLGRPAMTLAGYLASYSDRLRFQAHRTIDTKIAGAERQGRITGEFDARAIMAKAIVQTPGALDAAGRVVSMTLAAGMTDVFEANADAFAGWLYTAVLDGATCDVCEAADGTEYATWAEAMVDLPDGGPNPECYGETRCRCRLVPIPAGGDLTPAVPPPEPPPELPPVEPPPELVIPEPFAGSAYQEAYDTGVARDLAGVVGYEGDGPGFVLPLARADHEAIMQTGREVQAAIDARVAELTPRVSQPSLESRQAWELWQRALLDADAAAEKAAADPRFKGAATRAANIAKHAEEFAAKLAGEETHYVRLADVQMAERAALEEHGVVFAEGDALGVRAPDLPAGGRYSTVPPGVRDQLRLSAQNYPASWVAASNDYDELKLVRNETENGAKAVRSHYQGGGPSFIAMAERSEFDGEILTHELGHRMEETNPEIVRAERAFYEWRARGGSWEGARELAQDLYPEATAKGHEAEYSVFDGWTTRYMGKAYREHRDAGYLGSYEIVSQSFGEAFGRDGGMLVDRATLRRASGEKSIRDDRELMQWLYGLMTRVKRAP